MNQLIPHKNCKVMFEGKCTRVTDTRSDSIDGKNIQILTGADTTKWVSLSEIEHGYKKNDHVIHMPSAGKGYTSLGAGVVLDWRTDYGVSEILVQFFETGEIRWLRWQFLTMALSVEARMQYGKCGKFDDHAERTRLRTLARGLQIWDSNTGAFGRLDIDPLPHQIDVAKKVVSSPQARWLLADDVGLGKTIEVGLIIHALAQRNKCRRVLIVCPSALTKQWKEEMRFKFSRFFQIYRRDFTPEYPDEIKLQDNVIVSLDLAKKEAHLNLLLQAGEWDVIIFDEAHRLSKSESGEKTERYKLAEALVLMKKAPSFLFLTATPHQGKTEHFRALLKLVRPDLQSEISDLVFNREIIQQLIIRNKKTKVTDSDGKFIFRGHDTKRIIAPRSKELQEMDLALRKYLRSGYNASGASTKTAKERAMGRAIGFVMTTYRKLASSSIAAIERALERRLERLNNDAFFQPSDDFDPEDFEGADNLAEIAENFPDTPPDSFFDNEIEELKNVLAKIRQAHNRDTKIEKLLNEILEYIFKAGESILIFTEYRATQDYLSEQIERKFPKLGKCLQINGSMSFEHKMDNIHSFNEGTSKVLISTEAGGEGLNLHESCHIMINYDLPWNPSRLVQRIGRLYRYGQEKRVQVINIQSDDDFDNKALGLMLHRVSIIAEQMASVLAEDIASDQTHEALADEILGELLSQIDMSEILERATLDISRTEEEIEEAINNAKKAREDEEDFLKFSNSYTSNIQGGFTNMHMVSFVEGMCSIYGIKVRQKFHNDQTIEIEIPDEFVGKWAEFGRKKVVRLSTDRRSLQKNDDLIAMDFECSFVSELENATRDRYEFDGLYCHAKIQNAPNAIAIQDVRWKDNNGNVLEEELLAIGLFETQWDTLKHERLADLLINKWNSSTNTDATIEESKIKEMRDVVNKDLASRSSDEKTPANDYIYAAAKFSRS